MNSRTNIALALSILYFLICIVIGVNDDGYFFVWLLTAIIPPAIYWQSKVRGATRDVIDSQKLKHKEEEMLRIKQLLDANLMSQEEFKERISQLKAK